MKFHFCEILKYIVNAGITDACILVITGSHLIQILKKIGYPLCEAKNELVGSS